MRPSGELSVVNAGVLRRALAEPMARGRTDVVLDLAEVTFMDSSTIGVLVSINNQANALGARFTIVSAHPDFQRLFAITGLDRVLSVVAAVEPPEPGTPGA